MISIDLASLLAGVAMAAPADPSVSARRPPANTSTDASDEHLFETSDGVAIFRLQGYVSPERRFRLVKSAIASAKAQLVRELLIDISKLEWFETPSVSMRHFMFREWARAAGAVVRLAFVAKTETIDPEKIEIIAARNFGATAEMFSSETEAMAWLHEQCEAAKPPRSPIAASAPAYPDSPGFVSGW